MLHDDASVVYDKAMKAGVPIYFKEWPGMFHVFQLLGDVLPEARKAWREVGKFICKSFNHSVLPDEIKQSGKWAKWTLFYIWV